MTKAQLKAWYSKIGKKGGKKTAARGSEYYRTIGAKGLRSKYGEIPSLEERQRRRRAYKAIKTGERRVKQLGLGGSFTTAQWDALKTLYGNKCAHCGKKEPKVKLTADHVIPVTGWEEWFSTNPVNYQCNDILNIQPLCGSCNSKKRTKIMPKQGVDN